MRAMVVVGGLFKEVACWLDEADVATLAKVLGLDEGVIVAEDGGLTGTAPDSIRHAVEARSLVERTIAGYEGLPRY